jgi:hypothetical protein
MPSIYIIVGTVAAEDGADRSGLRVQALDRDMPSVERTMPMLASLGEAPVDGEGRFEITYSIEQFQAVDATPQLRPPNADISFRVFDSQHRELTGPPHPDRRPRIPRGSDHLQRTLAPGREPVCGRSSAAGWRF